MENKIQKLNSFIASTDRLAEVAVKDIYMNAQGKFEELVKSIDTSIVLDGAGVKCENKDLEVILNSNLGFNIWSLIKNKNG